MKLNNTQCKNAKYNPNGSGNKLSDGGGLFLHLKETGKYWRMNYRFVDKQKTLYVGVYPEVTLAEAREKRDEARKLIDAGKDPATQKKLAKLELQANHDNSFERIGREWHSQKLHTWKPEHAANILKRLETTLFKKIGTRPIKEVTTPELLSALRILENEGKRDLAHRQLQHCSQIFRYAIATGRADSDITTHLKGALQPVKSKGLAYLPEKELPAFLRKLERYDTEYRGALLTKLAFKLMVLTFVRSGEIRGAKWDEINWEKAQWKIPAERMKMKDPHIVPLAKQSLEILKQIRLISGHSLSGYIFPSQNDPRKTMSENTFLRVIDVMGYKGQTTGRSWVAGVVNQQVGQANVNGTKLKQLAVPVMHEDEQKEIVRRIEKAFASIDAITAQVQATQKQISHLEAQCLNKAFRGELVPQDPNDEPASVLLERIAAEVKPTTTKQRQPKRKAA